MAESIEDFSRNFKEALTQLNFATAVEITSYEFKKLNFIVENGVIKLYYENGVHEYPYFEIEEFVLLRNPPHPTFKVRKDLLQNAGIL